MNKKLANQKRLLNKKYDEIYGLNKAKNMKGKKSQSLKNFYIKMKNENPNWLIERSKKISNSTKGIKIGNRKGTHQTEQTKQKTHETWKKKRERGYISPHIGKHMSIESRNKMGISRKNKTYEELYGIQEAHRKKELISKNAGKKTIESYKSGKRKSSSYEMKQHWQNSEYKERVIKAILQGLIKRPTSYEQKIIFIDNKYHLNFDYVGDGKIIINYVNPDFKHKTLPLLIEVYHDYFKTKTGRTIEQYEKERSERFAKFGFKTLFLKDEDILRPNWEEHCLNKIKEFMVI